MATELGYVLMEHITPEKMFLFGIFKKIIYFFTKWTLNGINDY